MAVGPFNQTGNTNFHSRPGEIKVPRGVYDYRVPSLWFDSSYIPEDIYGNKYLDPGLVVAQAVVATDATYGDTYAYVPYNSGASYGIGSDTAVGVLDVRLNATIGAEAVTPIYHGQLQERNCYVLGSTKGTIPAGVKSALPDIDWVGGVSY